MVHRNPTSLLLYKPRDAILRLSEVFSCQGLLTINNVESILEIALAGFSKNELNVYTEYGKLIVEGKKEKKEKESEYVYQGLAQRSFNRTWSLSEDIEVREVLFKDGLLTVKLGKVVPEHHARKDYM